MKKNINIKVLILEVIAIMLVMIAITFAISYLLQINLNITTTNLAVNYSGTLTLPSTSLSPIPDSDIDTNTENVMKVEFTVKGASTNTTTEPIIYDVILSDLNIDCELKKHLKWKLYKNNTVLSTGSFLPEFDTLNDNKLWLTEIQQDLPKSNQTADSYKFVVWLSENCTDITNCSVEDDQSGVIGGTISGKIETVLYTNSKKALIRETSNEELICNTTGSEKLIRLSQGNTWESGANGLYEVNYTKLDGSTIGKDYRYIGGNVNNYIRFNNDLYRIIGIFDENTHGIEGEYLIKIISKDLLSANSWGVVNTDASGGTYSNYYNDWTGKQYTTPANANILLNQYFLNKTNTSDTYGSCSNWTYFNNSNNYKTYNCDLIAGYGIDNTYRDYIETTTWHLNGYNGNGLTSNNFYLCERGMYTNCTSANNGAGDTSTSAKIGLMYVSDYMYASGYKASSSTLTGSSNYNGSQNWMFKGYEWTITSFYSLAYNVFNVSSLGYVNYNISSRGCGVRPTFYLKSNVKIIGGNGTIDNPYTISM